MTSRCESDCEAFADEEDIAEFNRALAAVSEDYRRVLWVLIPRLAALEERGDAAEALRLIAEIEAIVVSREPSAQ